MGTVSTDYVLTQAWVSENHGQPGTFGCMSRETAQVITVTAQWRDHSETIGLVHAGDQVRWDLRDVVSITIEAASYPAHVMIEYTNAPISLTAAPYLAGGSPSAPVPVTVSGVGLAGMRASMSGVNTAPGQAITDGTGGGATALIGANGYDTVDRDTGGFTTGHGLADGVLVIPAGGAGDYLLAAIVDAENVTAGSEYRFGLSVFVNGSLWPNFEAGATAPNVIAAGVPAYSLNMTGLLAGLNVGDTVQLRGRYQGPAGTTGTFFVYQFSLMLVGTN